MTHPLSPHSRDIVVKIPQGIHARVAARLVDIIGQSKTIFAYQGRQISGQSLLDILSLCVPYGATVTITAPQDVLIAIEQLLSPH